MYAEAFLSQVHYSYACPKLTSEFSNVGINIHLGCGLHPTALPTLRWSLHSEKVESLEMEREHCVFWNWMSRTGACFLSVQLPVDKLVQDSYQLDIYTLDINWPLIVFTANVCRDCWNKSFQSTWVEALQSLANASRKFLKEPNTKHVRLRFACEIDKNCRKVLCQTYSNQCLFGDVKSLTARDGWAHCFVHDKLCKFKMRRRRNSFLQALTEEMLWACGLSLCVVLINLEPRSGINVTIGGPDLGIMNNWSGSTSF